MYELFMSYGFRVRIIGYDEVAGNLGQEQIVGDSDNVLFVAEHLRFSDDEMEIWRREFQRIEGEGDEEGFEEL
ncbi:S-adenosyl-L-methionine-dependent methyltransferase [Tanacetum coccineum]